MMRKNLIRYRQMTSTSARGKNVKRVCKQKSIVGARRLHRKSWHNFKIALGMQARKALLNKGLHRLAPIKPFGARQRWRRTEISNPVGMRSTKWTPYRTSTGPSGEAEGGGETTLPSGVERGRGRGRGFRGGDRGSGRGRVEGGRGRGRGGPSRTSSVVGFFFPLVLR